MAGASEKYSDIINMQHHRSEKYPPMSLAARAAQFAPFAALTGFDAQIEWATETFDGRTEIYYEDPENDIYKEEIND